MSLFGNLMIGIDYSFKSLLIYIYTDEVNDNAIEVKYIYEQFYLNWNILNNSEIFSWNIKQYL